MEQHPLNKTRLVLKRPEAHQEEQCNIPLLIEARKCVVCNRNELLDFHDSGVVPKTGEAQAENLDNIIRAPGEVASLCDI